MSSINPLACRGTNSRTRPAAKPFLSHLTGGAPGCLSEDPCCWKPGKPLKGKLGIVRHLHALFSARPILVCLSSGEQICPLGG